MSEAERLLQLGCQEMGCKPEDVKIISDDLETITGDSTLACVGLALQIISCDGFARQP